MNVAIADSVAIIMTNKPPLHPSSITTPLHKEPLKRLISKIPVNEAALKLGVCLRAG